MKSILILGAGVMQGPAIRIAREKGYRVVVADGNADAVHASTADGFLHIDLKDREALAIAAAAIDGLAGVFTAGTDFSASVAWVAERLGLPGIPYEVALDASDKARMRARLSAAGVPVPPFASGGAYDDPEFLAARVSAALGSGSASGSASSSAGAGPAPLVVKPVDNMGARGCRLARTASELREAWSDAVGHSRTGRAIVEGYLEGPEFSLDAIVSRGRVVLRGIADRIVVFEPFFVEMGHTMPTAYGPEVVGEVVSVFEAGIAALGIRDGAAKGDIKYTRSGAFVGEIAARLSGGYMSGWTYPYSSGIEATAEAIDIACGVEPAFSEPSLSLVCSERAWISIPGTIASIVDGARAASADPASGPGRAKIRDVFPRAVAGDRVVFPCNNVQKCGNVIAVAPTRAEADSAAESAARSVLIRLEAGDPSTGAFIRGDDRMSGPGGAFWPPEAFPGLSAMVRASIASMPDTLRANRPAATVSIAPLRGLDDEEGVDWQGRSIRESLDAVAAMTGATVGMHGDLVLGASFWRAFARGGYQAGAWVVDTTVAAHAALPAGEAPNGESPGGGAPEAVLPNCGSRPA